MAQSRNEAILCISVTSDGFLRGDAKIEFIKFNKDRTYPWNQQSRFDYPYFIEDADCILMSEQKYVETITQLSPYVWPYANQKTYVITDKIFLKNIEKKSIEFVRSEDQYSLFMKLRGESDKKMWVCSRPSFVNELLTLKLVDRLMISKVKVEIKDGEKLFDDIHEYYASSKSELINNIQYTEYLPK